VSSAADTKTNVMEMFLRPAFQDGPETDVSGKETTGNHATKPEDGLPPALVASGASFGRLGPTISATQAADHSAAVMPPVTERPTTPLQIYMLMMMPNLIDVSMTSFLVS